MQNSINIGIDLGTSNSVICKFIQGEVKVFNNPQDYGRCTLPSVVGFRKDRIIVGSKAKEYMEKEPLDVKKSFKRKMGTTESYKIKSLNDSRTPVELSALVLKELKTFVVPNENIDSAVITIPASFDTLQSNATKKAGLLAGFKQVVLLQEPIAASLAYANIGKRNLEDGQWLVYDLGGGTFDVALIKINDGEMKVVDHEGDNYLGGIDFDNLIVEKIIIPRINERYKFSDLESAIKSESNKLNAQYYVLSHRAEVAKIDLSVKLSTEIIVDGFEDKDGEEVDFEITITRSEFNNLIKPFIEKTTNLIKEILTRNSLVPSDIQFTLMVGGSTFIPYVRQQVKEVIQTKINCEVDPTTAVAIGAAYYASTKTKELEILSELIVYPIFIKAVFPNVSKEKEEYFAARITGGTDGLYYRITRNDQGFDSGLKRLSERISEDLPLVDNTFNSFNFMVYDEQNNTVETNFKSFGINSGYGISGQPLPDDICLEVDDLDNPGETKLELIFQRNTPLPAKTVKTKTLTKTIFQGNDEDVIRINVLEGSHQNTPEANKCLGIMTISGRQLKRDVLKGSDIEITIEISESRDIITSAYLNMADQEFKQPFKGQDRHTNIDKLQIEVVKLENSLEEEISSAVEEEFYEKANELTEIKKQIETIKEATLTMPLDDVTDKKYQLEDKKRSIAQKLFNLTKDKKFLALQKEYFQVKQECYDQLVDYGNDYEMKRYNDLVSFEQTFMTSSNMLKLKQIIDQLNSLSFSVLLRVPEYLQSIFSDIVQNKVSKLNNQAQGRSLIEAGNLAVTTQNWVRLREIVFGLWDLMPRNVQDEIVKENSVGYY